MRGGREFAAADAIREELRRGGWEVVDTAGGSELKEASPGPELLPGRRLTYLAIVSGWPQDAARWLSSVVAHPGDDWEAVLGVDSTDPEVASWVRSAASERVRPLTLEPAGFAVAVNRAVAESRGEVIVLMDPGTELTGEVAGPLLAALSEPGTGLAGAFGLRARGTVKEFAPHEGPEVDALEGYCLACRREDFLGVGGFDGHFRFYRIADIEFSFRMRAAGHRAVVVPGLPVRRHAHRVWESTPPEERERLSKRNFYRFLDRWGGRPDLLVR
ncbi:MAG: glycosyltransferase [Candidatus Dormibacterales bacterium]